MTKYFVNRKLLKIDLPSIQGRSEKITIYAGYIIEVNYSLNIVRIRNGFNPNTLHQVSNRGVNIKVDRQRKLLQKIDDLLKLDKIYEKTKTQLGIE